MKSGSTHDTTYRLVVRGELDERFAYLFEGMRMERTEGTTVIAGPVRDQTMLHGLFERIDELGLELLLAQQVDTSPLGSGQERGERGCNLYLRAGEPHS